MSETVTSSNPQRHCDDLGYRLAVYEAGHALTARALGLNILSVRMLPRPPVMASDKILRGNTLNALVSVLENRCVELFGGQIAEQHTCASGTAFSGDVARIDELCRLISGIDGQRSVEDVWFELEDVAEQLFAEPRVRGAILPLADFFYNKVEAGHPVVPGAEVEAFLDEVLGEAKPKRKGRLSSLFSRA